MYGCVGLECEIPDYEMRTFETEQECNTALEFWMKSSPDKVTKTYYVDGKKKTTKDMTGQHVGICYQPDTPPKKVEIWLGR